MSFFKRLFGSTNKKQSHGLPDGWTETKISDDTYVTHIPQEQKDKWVADRHKHDNVNELIKKDGFYDKANGRSGTIYHVDNGKLCEIDFEISGVKQFDILIYFDSLKEWLLPDKKALTPVEKLHIKEKLLLWLDSKKIKADL
jgi:hypothetical protein